MSSQTPLPIILSWKEVSCLRTYFVLRFSGSNHSLRHHFHYPVGWAAPHCWPEPNMQPWRLTSTRHSPLGKQKRTSECTKSHIFLPGKTYHKNNVWHIDFYFLTHTALGHALRCWNVVCCSCYPKGYVCCIKYDILQCQYSYVAAKLVCDLPSDKTAGTFRCTPASPPEVSTDSGFGNLVPVEQILEERVHPGAVVHLSEKKVQYFKFIPDETKAPVHLCSAQLHVWMVEHALF